MEWNGWFGVYVGDEKQSPSYIGTFNKPGHKDPY